MNTEDAGRRVGTFFLVLGILALALFGASDVAGSTYYPLFCAGGLLLLIGWFLHVRNRTPEEPKDSGRFSLFRSKPKEKKEQPKGK
jgi:protein-S-isoprenylcysteine O-methyltransferase Ste14